MGKKVTDQISIFVLFTIASSVMVSPISAQISIPQIPVIPLTATISVESSDMEGNAFPGQWVELWQNGAIIQEDFTPFSAEVESGTEYQVFIYDDPDELKFFDHWEDGSTDRMRPITISEDSTLIAFFQTDSATTTPMASLSVESADMSGTAFEGMWVELWQDGTIIQEDFTPFSAEVESGTQYEVFVYDWEDIVFDHWEDGNTDRMRPIIISEDSTVTAFYQTGQPNNPPVASDDTASTNENASVVIDVLANDSDPDGDDLTVSSVSSPTNGTAIVNSDSTITYTPNQGFEGTDSFEYSVSDGNGGNDTAMISITVKSSTPADKHQVIATIHVKINPKGIDVNPNSDKVYVTHYYSYSEGTVSIIDWQNNTSVTELPVRYAPEYISVNPNTNKIYLTHSGGYNNNINRVSVIDGTTDTVKTVVSIPGTAKRALGAIMANPATNQIYVASYHTDKLYVINGTSDTLAMEIPVPGGPNLMGINSLTNMIYTSQVYSNTVSVIDGSTNTLMDTITFSEPLRSVAVNEETNRVYVGGNRTVYVIDGTTNTVGNSIAVPSSSPWSLDIKSNPVTNMIYVIDQGGNAVFVIDGSTNSIIERVALAHTPTAIAVNHNTNLVYVANNSDDIVSVLQGPS